MATGSR